MDLHRKIKLAVGLMAGTLTMVNFLPASGMRSVADGQLRESGVGYYWLSDYFTIIDDFGKQYMGRGSKVSSEKVIEEGVVYHSAAGFQIDV
mgnify:CR=1 FL=1